jgi:hypothetical protein
MGEPEMTYVLILSIISSFGSVDSQRVTDFATYSECATHAVAWADSQQPLHPDSHLRWQCQRGDPWWTAAPDRGEHREAAGAIAEAVAHGPHWFECRPSISWWEVLRGIRCSGHRDADEREGHE